MIQQDIFIRQGSQTLNYVVYAPKDHKDSLPMIVFLHGAGERGTHIEHLSRHGLPKLIAEGREYEAIILCPQCHECFVWNNLVRDLKQVIDHVADKYRVDKARISITGGSMGGFGTWEMGLTYPSFFSAIAPICGGGLSWRASNLINTPVLAYHGALDPVVPLVYSELMVNAVNQSGGHASLCVFENLGHNDAIDMAYRNSDLVEQLLQARRDNFEPVSEALSQWF